MALLMGVGFSGGVFASSPGEKLVCTQAPRSTWMPEAKIREIFGEKNYSLVKFKVSGGNCYEFYAIHQDGSIVEAYYHPVSGEALRVNRVAATPGAPSFASRNAAPSASRP
ncbi:MAG: PepSY domain-containing protein [Azonexus sp.]